MAWFCRLAAVLAVLLLPLAAHAQGICPSDAMGRAPAVVTTFPYAIGSRDMCKMRVFKTAVSGNLVQVPAQGTAGQFIGNFPVWVLNTGTQIVTLTPMQTSLGGAAPTINGNASQPVTPMQGGMLAVGEDGNWYFKP
jgi:hypothetical protein